MIFGFYGMNVEGLPITHAWFPAIVAVAACAVAWLFLKLRKLY
ncbi:MAG: hypothetical protein ACI4PQ_07535 [Butyricicoccaceae bacterium]